MQAISSLCRGKSLGWFELNDFNPQFANKTFSVNDNFDKMEFLGRVGKRKIYYLQVRSHPEWANSLPKNDWIAFTIAHKEDEELIPPIVKKCIDKNVSYTCSSGELADLTEDYFDEEVLWRSIDENEFGNNSILMTTAHRDFEEGFWFSSAVAHDDKFDLNQVVCIDATKRNTKVLLIKLIEKINKGWLPPES
ncbi:hypothetical protein [Roseivirga echinicomitans]|nr:hypothetical protein [Roseivirga echinicomitans]